MVSLCNIPTPVPVYLFSFSSLISFLFLQSSNSFYLIPSQSSGIPDICISFLLISFVSLTHFVPIHSCYHLQVCSTLPLLQSPDCSFHSLPSAVEGPLMFVFFILIHVFFSHFPQSSNSFYLVPSQSSGVICVALLQSPDCLFHSQPSCLRCAPHGLFSSLQNFPFTHSLLLLKVSLPSSFINGHG